MVELLVVLVRVLEDDTYPEWIEAQVTDAEGKTWVFRDKVPSFTRRSGKLPLPSVGRMRCTLEEIAAGSSGKLYRVSTERPDHVCTQDGETASFWVLEEQLSSQEIRGQA